MSRKSNPPGPPTYEVGYGRPPHDTRFKKGRSGNPGGRPKKKACETPGDIVREELDRLVPVTENGKRQMRTVSQVSMRLMCNRALNGDFKAQCRLLQLEKEYRPADDLDVTGTPIDYGAEVRQMLNDMAYRMALRDAAEAALSKDEEPDESGSSA